MHPPRAHSPLFEPNVFLMSIRNRDDIISQSIMKVHSNIKVHHFVDRVHLCVAGYTHQTT